MFKKVFAIYERESIDIRQKAKNLFVMLLVLLLFIPLVIVFDILEADYDSCLVEAAVFGCFLLAFILFLKGKYALSSAVTIVLSSLLFITLLVISRVMTAQRMYSAALYMTGLLLVCMFIAPTALYTIVHAGLGLAVIIVLYVFLIGLFPAEAVPELQSSFIPVVFIYSGLAVIVITVSLSYGRMLAHLKTENEASKAQLEKVTRAESEVKRLNAGLEGRVAERTAQLEDAVRELEAFSHSVSHDLRAPLRTLEGFSRILLDDFAAVLPPEAVGHLETISGGARQLGKLIEALLDLSRLSRRPLARQAVAAADLVRQVLEDLRPEREGRAVEIDVGALPDCRADPVLLRQVWMNLLSNALKYTRGRDPARITVGWREEAGGTVYFVSDNGVGFDMRHSDKLFGMFQRLHREDEYEGTGVGLALARRIIARHGGRIWAAAGPEHGATFSFKLGE